MRKAITLGFALLILFYFLYYCFHIGYSNPDYPETALPKKTIDSITHLNDSIRNWYDERSKLELPNKQRPKRKTR